MRTLLFACLLAGLHASSVAHAACTMPTGTIELYADAGSHNNADICAADTSGGHTACRLRGWLYRPTSPGKHPAIVYVQGSGTTKNQSSMCSMINYFVNQNFVVWVPYLRGYDDTTTATKKDSAGNVVVTNPNASLPKAGFSNSGTYIATGSPGPAATVIAMQDEVDHELTWAIDYLNATYSSTVDATKIVLAGHSYGGITAELALERPLANKVAAIVDMSGGVLSFLTNVGGTMVVDFQWLLPMCISAGNRKVPLLVFQTTNESPTYGNPNNDLVDVVASTQSIFNCATSGSYQTQAEMHVYSPVPSLDVNGPWCASSDPANQCAHTTFVMDPMQVNRWAPAMKDFLAHLNISY